MTTKLDTANDRPGNGGAVEAALAVRVVGAGARRSDSRGEIEGHLLLDAGREALHRLQQPVDVRQHRPRRSARHQGDPGSGGDARVCESRSWPPRCARRLGQKLAQICPGDIDVFFFTNGGAEANENAIRIARLVTGRHKILARYRSYHGGTGASLTATGDPRRWAMEPGMPGIIHVPHPYHGPKRGTLSGADALAELEEVDHARGAADDRRLPHGNRHRHQRHSRAARRLSRRRARALRQARHPADLRRGDVGVRPHRRVVRRRSLEGRAGHPGHGEGVDERVCRARRRRHPPQDRRSLQGQGVLRRPDLQQPSARLRRGAGDDRRLRRGQADRAREDDGRGDARACSRS